MNFLALALTLLKSLAGNYTPLFLLVISLYVENGTLLRPESSLYVIIPTDQISDYDC